MRRLLCIASVQHLPRKFLQSARQKPAVSRLRMQQSTRSSPKESGAILHLHRLPTSASTTGDPGAEQVTTFHSVIWDGTRRHSLDMPSYPLPLLSSFDHIPLLAPLAVRGRSDGEVRYLITSGGGRTQQATQEERSVLPPLNSLVLTRDTFKSVKERGPKLAPSRQTPSTPPPLPQIEVAVTELAGVRNYHDPPILVPNRPVGRAPPE